MIRNRSRNKEQILRLVTPILAVALLYSANLAAQGNFYSVSLKDGTRFRLQVCTDSLLRIQASAGIDFQPSLLERYEILKSDWKSVTPTVLEEQDVWVLQTSSLRFSLSKESGLYTISTKSGRLLTKGCVRLNEKDTVMTGLASSLQGHFAHIKPVYAIIGEWSSDKPLTDSIKEPMPLTRAVVEMDLTKDDRFYGGGTASRESVEHRGKALRIWATYQKTELPVPFLLCSAGWGLFHNTTALNYFDIDRYRNGKLFVCNTTPSVDFYFLHGESMPGTLNLFTTLTGRPFILPKWAYGLAFGPNEKEDQFNILDDALRFRSEKIPCDIIWLEPQWMEKFHDFSSAKYWNFSKFEPEFFAHKDRYPKKEERGYFISGLHNLGYKTALWLCHNHDLTIEAEDALSAKNGLPLSGKEHWSDHLGKFIDQGIDGFKIDPGRTLMQHPSRQYYNGLTDNLMHNLNQVLLPKQIALQFRSRKGLRPFLHYCGGYAGTQRYVAMTCGDNGGGRASLFDQLNLSMSGFVNTSLDLETDIPHLHYGIFSPWVQLNSWAGLDYPWLYNAENKEAFRFYTQLRYSLLPYIYSHALEGSLTGMPILRPMSLAFPKEPGTDGLTNQYMFGDAYLVGVFSDSVYLPKGEWINYWTNETVSGGQTVPSGTPVNRGGALFIKNGAIIPFQKPVQFIGNRPLDTLVVKIYPAGESRFTLLEDDGETFAYETSAVARTTIDCVKKARSIDVALEVSGTYKAKPSKRVYEWQIRTGSKPNHVLLNARPVQAWTYNATSRFCHVTTTIAGTGAVLSIKQ